MLARVACAGRTDIGRKRESNQDQFLIADLHKSMLVQSTSLNLDEHARLYGSSQGRLFMVADGMGGHQAGSRASTLAIDLLVNQWLNSIHWFFALEAERESSFIEDLKKLFLKAHQAIEQESFTNEAHRGMGTTLTVAYIIWPWMYVVHAGDSRCYLVREQSIHSLTRDHTVSNQLVQQGGMKQEDAQNSPWSNVLYNALGAGGREVVADVYKVPVQVNDTIVLCTDGLYRHLKDQEIRDVVEREIEPAEACRALIELANYRGGLDNITCIVARLLEPDKTESPSTKVTAEIPLENLLEDTHETGHQPDRYATAEYNLADTLDPTR